MYIQCNTSPKFLFNYNKQTKPKDFENIIHKVPVYRYSGPSLQIIRPNQKRNRHTASFFKGRTKQKLDGLVGLKLYFSMAKVRKRRPFFPSEGGGVSFSPLLLRACWIQVQIQVNGLHFPEIYTLRPYAAQSVSEQHSHAISGLLVPWKNVPSNLCWFRCSELHVPETVCQAVTLPSETGFVGLSGLSLGRCLLQGLLHRKCSLYLLKGKCAFIFYSNHEKLLFFLSNYFWSDLGI